MNRPAHRINIPVEWMECPYLGVRQRMANALVGQEVSLMVNSKTIAHGIVTDVLGDGDFPQIVVGRAAYNLDQILSHIPAAFGRTAHFPANPVTSTKE